MVLAVPVRRLSLCALVVFLLAALPPAWADGEADQLARARQLVADKKYSDAITILVPITSSSDKPTAIQAKRALEECYRLSRQWDKAIPVLESLLRDYSAKPKMIEFLNQKLWRCYTVNDDWGGAVSAYQSLLQTHPEGAVRWQYQLGRCYRKMGKNPEAIASLEKAMELAKGDAEAIKQIEPELTDAYQDAKDVGKIAALFQKIEAVTPGYSVARANQLVIQAKYAAAEAILIPLASPAGPNSRQARRVLECCHRRAGEWDKAIPILESLLRERPEDTAQLKLSIGKCYRGLRDYSKTYSALKEGLEFTPRTPELTAALTGDLLRWCAENDGWEVASYEYRSLLKMQPEDAATWYCGLSLCYHKLHRDAEAVESVKKGLISTTRTPEVTRDLTGNLWDWCTEAKNWDPAVTLFKWLMEQQPKEAVEWQCQLGRCYREMGNAAEAITTLKNALGLAKGDKGAVERIGPELAKSYEDAKRFDNAQALLTRLAKEYSREARFLAGKGYEVMNSRDYAGGATAFRDVIDRFPFYDDIENMHVCYVECLQGQGKTDEAAAYAKKLYDDHPEWRDGALFAQGQLSFGSKKYDDAAATFRQAIRDYPNGPYVGLCRSFLVSALQKAGRIEEAVEMLKGTLAGESSAKAKAATMLQIGNVYYQAKGYRDAIKAFKEVRNLKDAPAEMKAEATYRSGLCYSAMKYYNSARICMDEVLKTYSDSRWASKAKGALYVWATYGKRATTQQ